MKPANGIGACSGSVGEGDARFFPWFDTEGTQRQLNASASLTEPIELPQRRDGLHNKLDEPTRTLKNIEARRGEVRLEREQRELLAH